MLLASSVWAATPNDRVSALSVTLKSVPVAEMPAKAANLVSQAVPAEQTVMAVAVVQAGIKVRPAATPSLVGAVCRVAPTAAAQVVAAASALQPTQSGAITRAAAAAAPGYAATVVSAAVARPTTTTPVRVDTTPATTPEPSAPVADTSVKVAPKGRYSGP